MLRPPSAMDDGLEEWILLKRVLWRSCSNAAVETFSEKLRFVVLSRIGAVQFTNLQKRQLFLTALPPTSLLIPSVRALPISVCHSLVALHVQMLPPPLASSRELNNSAPQPGTVKIHKSPLLPPPISFPCDMRISLGMLPNQNYSQWNILLSFIIPCERAH